MEQTNIEKNEPDWTKKAFEDTSTENPLNKLNFLKTKYATQLIMPVEFGSPESSILYFSNDIKSNEGKLAPFIEDFSRVVLWNSRNIIPVDKVSTFWVTLRAENGKSFKEMLDKMEELLIEIKNEIK